MQLEQQLAAYLKGKFFLCDGRDRNEVRHARRKYTKAADKTAAEAVEVEIEDASQPTLEQAAAVAKIEKEMAVCGRITPEAVIAAVAGAHDVTLADIRRQTRVFKVCAARHHACAMLREHFHMSYPIVARFIGLKDHTTVMNSCRRWEKLRERHAEAEDTARKLLGLE
jgi:chromosomal replication initiation ATPase DnaA